MPEQQLKAAIIIVSTTVAKDPTQDSSEAVLREVFAHDGGGHWAVMEVVIVMDDVFDIQTGITGCTDGDDAVDLIVTTGGTGFARSDRTPEAVSPLLHKQAPGLVHGMLSASLEVTPFALMSRPVAGVRGHTIIVTLPGSPKGARENLQSILPLLPHACRQARGESSRKLHAGGVKQLELDAGIRSRSKEGSSRSHHSHSHSHEHSSQVPVHRHEIFERRMSSGDHPESSSASHHARSHGQTSLDQGNEDSLPDYEGSRDIPKQSPSHNHNGHTHAHDHSSHSHKSSHMHQMPVRYTSSMDRPQSNDPSLGPTKRSRSSPYPMLSVNDAINLIKEHTPLPRLVRAWVSSDLVGSVLAEDIKATEAVPAYRASIVDGYAISSAAGSSVKGVYKVASVSHAKAGEQQILQPGQIARVTTGAPVPEGQDLSVVMVEDTVLKSTTDDIEEEEEEVEILADKVRPGTNIREIGSDIQLGSVLLHRGEEITASGGELGLLASVGRAKVMVYKKPVVGVMSTGDEIVEHDKAGPLEAGEVRDCNRPMILAALRRWGYDTIDLKITKDTPADLELALRDAFRKVDVLITTGGVSMGELDLLKPTIERSLGGTIHFGRVSMKPGKPTTFGTVSIKDNNCERSKKVIFALPGNPVSGIVTLHLFVLPSLHFASGVSPGGLSKVVAELAHEFPLDPARPEYHRSIVTLGKDGVLRATSTGAQRSSKVGSLRSANALVCLPAGKDYLRKGTMVEALLMCQIRSEWDFV